MSRLDEIIKLTKENGELSEPFVMRKLKVSAIEAADLIKQAEKCITAEMQEKNSKLRKIEIHFTAEYE